LRALGEVFDRTGKLTHPTWMCTNYECVCLHSLIINLLVYISIALAMCNQYINQPVYTACFYFLDILKTGHQASRLMSTYLDKNRTVLTCSFSNQRNAFLQIRNGRLEWKSVFKKWTSTVSSLGVAWVDKVGDKKQKYR
jgi:hypothetical protein